MQACSRIVLGLSTLVLLASGTVACSDGGGEGTEDATTTQRDGGGGTDDQGHGSDQGHANDQGEASDQGSRSDQATGTPDATSGGDAAESFWEETYDPACAATVPDGEHRAGQACNGCHKSFSAGNRPRFVFAGTVSGSKVEVGVKDGSGLRTVCSASNGNFWLTGEGDVDWANAEVRIRNANGETSKHPPKTVNDNCNGCHSGGDALEAP